MKVKEARECGDEHVLKGREPLQMGWYELASTLAEGRTVLDVGCGSGEGLSLLATKAKKATGIDLDPRLKREDIEICDISQVPDKSYDLIVCIDVIEHVQDDKAFVRQLARVARRKLFVSTPNYTVSRNAHPYHVREYTPSEFEQMFTGLGRVRIFGGNCTGELREEITNKGLYYFINNLYNTRGTVLLAKVVKRLLFTKVWGHQAVVVEVN
jgi:SAM-dependent methyltransferase